MNDFLEKAQHEIEKFRKEYKIGDYLEDFNRITYVKSGLTYLKTNEYTKGLYQVVENANNNNSPVIKIDAQKHDLTYQKRKDLVLGATGVVFILTILTKKRIFPVFRRTLFYYIFFSMLLCRENFNLRNYKV